MDWHTKNGQEMGNGINIEAMRCGMGYVGWYESHITWYHVGCGDLWSIVFKSDNTPRASYYNIGFAKEVSVDVLVQP